MGENSACQSEIYDPVYNIANFRVAFDASVLAFLDRSLLTSCGGVNRHGLGALCLM